jgi:hypothetical protein
MKSGHACLPGSLRYWNDEQVGPRQARSHEPLNQGGAKWQLTIFFPD